MKVVGSLVIQTQGFWLWIPNCFDTTIRIVSGIGAKSVVMRLLSVMHMLHDHELFSADLAMHTSQA